MELLYLLLPIIGAFIMLFAVCFCGKKVKELLHIPKEVAIGRHTYQFEMSRRDAPNRQETQRQSLGTLNIRNTSFRQQKSQAGMIRNGEFTEIDETASTSMEYGLHDISQISEQEMMHLLLTNEHDCTNRRRMFEDSGVMDCMSSGCSFADAPVEHSGATAIKDKTETLPQGAHGSAKLNGPAKHFSLPHDLDDITVLEDGTPTHSSRPTSHCHHSQEIARWDRHAKTIAYQKRRDADEIQSDIHKPRTRSTASHEDNFCPCDLAAAQRYRSRHATAPCRREQYHPLSLDLSPRDITSEQQDSRRRHLSVGSCDTVESDIIIHVVDDSVFQSRDSVTADHDAQHNDTYHRDNHCLFKSRLNHSLPLNDNLHDKANKLVLIDDAELKEVAL